MALANIFIDYYTPGPTRAKVVTDTTRGKARINLTVIPGLPDIPTGAEVEVIFRRGENFFGTKIEKIVLTQMGLPGAVINSILLDGKLNTGELIVKYKVKGEPRVTWGDTTPEPEPEPDPIPKYDLTITIKNNNPLGDDHEFTSRYDSLEKAVEAGERIARVGYANTVKGGQIDWYLPKDVILMQLSIVPEK